MAIQKSEYKKHYNGNDGDVARMLWPLKWGEPHEGDRKIVTVLRYMWDAPSFRSWFGRENAKRWKTSVAFIKAVNFCGQGKPDKCSRWAHAHLFYYKRDQAQGDTRLTVFVLPHETHQCYSSIYGKKSETFQENGKSFLVVDVDKYWHLLMLCFSVHHFGVLYRTNSTMAKHIMTKCQYNVNGCMRRNWQFSSSKR